MSLATVHQPAAEVPTKPKRTRSPKAASRPESPRARKVSFYLSPDAIERLGIAAIKEDTDKSRLLERVIQASPIVRRWVVSDRAKSDDCGTVEGSAEPAA